MGESWLSRRTVHPDGRTLLDVTGPEQWLNAVYFIFTVFTTVGFGDMSASTPIEICYVIVVMVVGTIFHSIIVGELIGALTQENARTRTIEAQKEIVAGYAEHAEISKYSMKMLKTWVNRPTKGEVDFDRDGMRQLISSSKIPRYIIGELPTDVFKGELMKNEFVASCRSFLREQRPIPPRFTILLSVLLSKASYLKEDILYREHDHPFNIFLVLHGTFAYAAEVTMEGLTHCLRRLSNEVGAVQGQVSNMGKEVEGLRRDITDIRNEVRAFLQICQGQHSRPQLQL